MVELTNKRTGEVYKARFGEVYRDDVPFRSKTDLKGFKDDEYYEPGTSLTDPSQVLNVKETVDRIMKGEIAMPNLSGYDIKLDENGQPVGMTLDEAFDMVDPTQAPGFDIADVPDLLLASVSSVSQAEKTDLPTTQAGVANYKASDGAGAVDKSDDEAVK